MAASRVGQRFKKGDRVRKKTIGGTKPPRFGVVLSAQQKPNARGQNFWYYTVQWDDLKSPAIHAQHVLLEIE